MVTWSQFDQDTAAGLSVLNKWRAIKNPQTAPAGFLFRAVLLDAALQLTTPARATPDTAGSTSPFRPA
ncbi:hypothetical protein, partial [Xanthomonas hortorum]|uniref:hypothetical protein n=1 Tax=Xanthomonas hortorum TaxID=56454 RepID=UPI0019D358C0